LHAFPLPLFFFLLLYLNFFRVSSPSIGALLHVILASLSLPVA